MRIPVSSRDLVQVLLHLPWGGGGVAAETTATTLTPPKDNPFPYNEVCVPTELRSCVKVEVAVLGSPFLISLMVSVDGKQH